MSRVRIRNTSNINIGFSFAHVLRGRSVLIEESKILERDHRMIVSKNLLVEPEFPVENKIVPVEEVKVDVPKDKGTPEEINDVPLVPDEKPFTVSPSTLDKPKPVAPEPAPKPEPAALVITKLTKEQLGEMTKAELKALCKDIKVDGRSRTKMIEKILESQEK